ncbi:TetR/AcrR family transcriptional regulator [Xenorhabdus sp. 12]|uniref:TetR/AcrR family transcriptional regulator n=1 Tax=Xenorhabdus santafensis TaxID=2582833 RepID=A0ABU4SAK9_9GAMM|nr:TetR/AcrR family transcriptional regulator [Xenorhabdus sp. 12]MDX7987800.1 TetR/AcrR family transcriptional regulator [Xenorhabdus sp. 12]
MKKKGRPRSYDSEVAIKNITFLFWRKGFTATSLDDLVNETGMNKPSLYAAFGNKLSIYKKAMDNFGVIAITSYENALKKTHEKDTIIDRITRYLIASVDLYTGENGKLGCMALSTAAAEVEIPEVQQYLAMVIQVQTDQIKKVLSETKNNGELLPETDVDIIAQLIIAILHSISLRARAGEHKATLMPLAYSAKMILEPVTMPAK